jgi:acyl-CoA thioesterase-2
MTDDNQKSIEHLLRVLSLRPVPGGGFEADTEQDEGRLFGGLVLAQAVVAAGRTVTSGSIHSLHAYFLRAGRPAKPIAYGIEHIRDGRNFTTRRVSAMQDGDMIFEASVSFVAPEEGISHQAPMPEAPDPESQRTWWETVDPPRGHGRPHRHRWANPIDIRSAETGPPRPPSERLPHRAVWGRPSAPLPEDPLIHAAAMAYYSDSGMVATVAHAYGTWQPGGATASLDHAMWFHHLPRFDDWLLYVTDSPAAHAARAVTWGGMYNREGTRVASVAQEGLYRKPA